MAFCSWYRVGSVISFFIFAGCITGIALIVKYLTLDHCTGQYVCPISCPVAEILSRGSFLLRNCTEIDVGTHQLTLTTTNSYYPGDIAGAYINRNNTRCECPDSQYPLHLQYNMTLHDLFIKHAGGFDLAIVLLSFGAFFAFLGMGLECIEPRKKPLATQLA